MHDDVRLPHQVRTNRKTSNDQRRYAKHVSSAFQANRKIANISEPQVQGPTYFPSVFVFFEIVGLDGVRVWGQRSRVCVSIPEAPLPAPMWIAFNQEI